MTQMDLFQTATSSQPDTHANHFHKPGSEEAVKMTDISGRTYFPLFKESDPLGAFSKMFMGTSQWVSTKCYLTWKGKATPQGRSLFQLVPLTHLTEETDSGSSVEMWATPRTSDTNSGRTLNEKGQRISKSSDLVFGANLADQVKMWPTPRACTAMSAENIHNRAKDKFPNLESEVARSMFPTPSASDNRDCGHVGMPAIKRRMEKGKQLNLSMVVSEVSGSLNPEWVEWLMGYPRGWTDLKD
jgi:hypothetical protein